IIVDEGPGLSGSSLFCVAQALQRAGIEMASISIFPGHGGPPGAAASDEICRWFDQVPRYVAPLGQQRWGGMPLTSILENATRHMLDGAQNVTIEDVSGGGWRAYAYENAADWP